MNPTFAVVDIETTGTNPKTDRIIQIGCILIENNQIVGRYATDVNPGQPIPKQIINLTKISPYQVKKAPYFEDIAWTIYHLLSETTFVAHNIHFDYQFLNEEFIRCGLPPLEIPGVDTVELAQIFLPTETSYRLNDLAERFGFEHENPHQALSDAEVTANLLLYIKETAQQLPLITMEKLLELSGATSYQTGQFIAYLLEMMRKNPQVLVDDLQIVHGIALRKKENKLFEMPLFTNHYPKTKKEKQSFFYTKMEYRKSQQRLMNLIYQHFTEGTEKNLFIEASTGMGKTIGYLFPLSFIATPQNPVIVSTASILLQQQLMEEDLPKLNAILPCPLQGIIIKGKHHYIDLQRFKVTLDKPLRQKQYTLYQMRILVWLTQTQTGDLGELNILQAGHLLFDEIRHRGVEFLLVNQPFYEEDFLRYLYKKMNQSNLLVVNHAFLAQETQRTQPLLPASDYLIIDEAHHLPEIVEKVSNQFVDTEKFQRLIKSYQDEGQLFNQIENLFANHIEANHLFDLYQEELIEIYTLQEEIIAAKFKEQPVKVTHILQHEQWLASKDVHKLEKKLFLYYDEALFLQERLLALSLNLQEQWLERDKIIFGKLVSLFSEMTLQAQMMKKWFYAWESQYVHKIYLYASQNTARLELIDLAATLLPQTSWYPRYKKIVYLGGTLTVPRQPHYFAQRLGITAQKVRTFPSEFDYQLQAKFYVVDEEVALKDLDYESYVTYLTRSITTLLKKNEQSALVLFTSHEVLQDVYARMHLHFLENGREILAQGIGGSRERLLRRFKHSKSSILFGADSFWEGVDLPGDSLELIIVTRLPFEHPSRKMIEAKTRYFSEQRLNYFKQEALPKVSLKLRQGLGRLIRSREDQGVFILLDSRILDASYGKQLQQALPKSLPIERVSLSEARDATCKFLNSKENNEKTFKKQ